MYLRLCRSRGSVIRSAPERRFACVEVARVPTHRPLLQSVCRNVAVVTISCKAPIDPAHNALNDDFMFPDPCQHQSRPDGARR